jgi:hypothetical protein
MRERLLFTLLSGSLALAYLWIAYTSGSEKTRDGDLLAGALLYGPLIVAALAALFWKTASNFTARPWVLLLVLLLSTALMIGLGYNMAGGLVGLVNLVLCWVLAVQTTLAAARRDA